MNQRQGRFSEARKILNEINESLPTKKKFFELFYDTAYIYYRCGEYTKAYKLLGKIINRKLPKEIKK